MSIYYINGEVFEDAHQAKISIHDRSVRFGDGAFETIAFHNKQLFLLDYHLERLFGGLQSINIKYDISGLISIFENLISKVGFSDGFIRCSITRGEGSRGYLPTYKSEPSVIIEVYERREMETTEVDLCISSYKKIPKECLPVEYKLSQGLNSSLAKEEAKNKNFFDSIMLSIDGYVCECSSSNIFFFKDGILHTPSDELPLLQGVIRRFVLENKNPGFEIQQGKYTLQKLETADEIFITNTAIEVLPVRSIEALNYKLSDSKKHTKILQLLKGVNEG